MQVVNQADTEEKKIIKTKLKDNKFGLNQNQNPVRRWSDSKKKQVQYKTSTENSLNLLDQKGYIHADKEQLQQNTKTEGILFTAHKS